MIKKYLIKAFLLSCIFIIIYDIFFIIINNFLYTWIRHILQLVYYPFDFRSEISISIGIAFIWECPISIKKRCLLTIIYIPLIFISLIYYSLIISCLFLNTCI